jgi:hypothetical protein
MNPLSEFETRRQEVALFYYYYYYHHIRLEYLRKTAKTNCIVTAEFQTGKY